MGYGMNDTQSLWQQFDFTEEETKFDGVSIASLAQVVETPFYLYSWQRIAEKIAAYQKPLKIAHQVHYAVKANANGFLLKRFAEAGLGFDIVSAGELKRVLAAGGAAEKVVFSGVAKTVAEIDMALAAEIGCFNVESGEELRMIAERAQALGKEAKIAVRVNPDVDAQTHPYIATGLRDSKFGVALEDAPALYRHAAKMAGVRVVGVGCHLGSQIVSLAPFVEACESLLQLANQLRDEGMPIVHFDMGGGLGIANAHQVVVPDANALLAAFEERLLGGEYVLHVQPGRSVIAEAGVLISRVVLTKTQYSRRFVMIDAGMNDYVRPALYQVKPEVRNVSRRGEAMRCDVVGPVCESGDVFLKDTPLVAQANDLLAFAATGAYGMSMASTYNTRALPAEVCVVQGQPILIRQREPLEQIWQAECEKNMVI